MAQNRDRIDVVFHLAGFAHDTAGHGLAEKYFRCNVNATKALADFSINFGVNRFLYVSSAKAGGEGSTSPISESTGGSPNSYYGKSKKEAEEYLLNLEPNKMMVSIIRPVLIYGPDMKGNLEQLKSAIQAGFPSPPKGLIATKSMIHVDDCVRCMVHLIGLPPSDPQVYLITDNYEYSAYDIDSILAGESRLFRIRFPIWLIAVLRMIPFFSAKFDKLYGPNLYSSEKLYATGFRCKASLSDINRKLF